jgi:hypothetical protein
MAQARTATFLPNYRVPGSFEDSYELIADNTGSFVLIDQLQRY